MALIPISQARQVYTQAFLGAWKESYPVTNFLRSFLTNKTSSTKLVSVEVSRGTNLVAADIKRGTETNRNKFGLSTMRVYEPPLYGESFTNEDLSLYDQLFGTMGEVTDTQIVAEAVMEVTDRYRQLRDKIERAYEVQAAQMLTTGIITVANGDNVDYKRKSALSYAVSTKWDNATPQIFADLQAACDKLRENGAAAAEFDVIMGASAASYMLKSAEYKEFAKVYALSPSDYVLPKLNSTSGGVFHNRISVGPYIVNLWSYPASYRNSSGTSVDYIDAKKVVIIAKSAQFYMSFAAVPRVLTTGLVGQATQFTQTLENGAYILSNFIKPEVSSHIFEIKSAGLALPLTIDHYATLTVLA